MFSWNADLAGGFYLLYFTEVGERTCSREFVWTGAGNCDMICRDFIQMISCEGEDICRNG